MDYKRIGSLLVRFHEGKPSKFELKNGEYNFYLTVSFGGQSFSTSSKQMKKKTLTWEDSMKFTKTVEETLMISCFCENRLNEDLIVGSAILPIQSAVAQGSFKGTVLLMNLGSITFSIVVEIKFEEKAEIPFSYPTLIYPLAPPEHPHVHAYDVPFNFTYTPPAYYGAKNGGDYLVN